MMNAAQFPGKKVLHLTLTKKWFEEIRFYTKREEYREIKPYWQKRLAKEYDLIIFRNGYSPTSPVFAIELKSIRIGRGVPDWGAPEKDVFILELGQILAKEGC